MSPTGFGRSPTANIRQCSSRGWLDICLPSALDETDEVASDTVASCNGLEKTDGKALNPEAT